MSAVAEVPMFEREAGRRASWPSSTCSDLGVDLDPAQAFATPMGARMTLIRGPRAASPGRGYRGELLPGGGDWILAGDDGIGRLDVRSDDADRRRRADLNFEGEG